jgi:streptogramin lyase
VVERGGKVARVTMSGAITEYLVPNRNAPFPWGIAAGPDGNMWFTENLGNMVAKVTMSGAISEYLVPTPGSWPSEITAGPDGNLWFTENQSNAWTVPTGGKVAKVTTSGVITEYAASRWLTAQLHPRLRRADGRKVGGWATKRARPEAGGDAQPREKESSE